MKFQVYDEDGFLSLVNTDQYQTFVDEDWSFEQLFEHFVAEMNSRNIIVWQTSSDGGGEWTVEVLDKPTDKPAFRSFAKTIEVSNGTLYLVNYTDLTMAAQFDDITLPKKENADWKITLPNGRYEVTVRQIFDPNELEEDADQTAFEIIISNENIHNNDIVQKIFWLEEYGS